MVPMSPLNSPTFFCLHVYNLWIFVVRANLTIPRPVFSDMLFDVWNSKFGVQSHELMLIPCLSSYVRITLTHLLHEKMNYAIPVLWNILVTKAILGKLGFGTWQSNHDSFFQGFCLSGQVPGFQVVMTRRKKSSTDLFWKKNLLKEAVEINHSYARRSLHISFPIFLSISKFIKNQMFRFICFNILDCFNPSNVRPSFHEYYQCSIPGHLQTVY